MQNTIKINTPHWFDATVSIDASRDDNGNFYSGIWYSGEWTNKRWFSTIFDDEAQQYKKSYWLSGMWHCGVIWYGFSLLVELDSPISPKSFHKPNKTLSLNYAIYTI